MEEKALQKFTGNSLVAIEQSRAVQEVQASLMIAKNIPRDQFEGERRILEACKRKSLAESAIYAYPRGGQTVSGPSIRLAEVLAQNWGNLSYGVRELEREDDRSIMQAYCWDLETNTKREMTFQVGHFRDTRKDGKKKLTDERDIYEMVSNQGARRVRSCILGIIPPDIVESAVEQINKTLSGGTDEPIKDRARKMLRVFEKFSVSKEMLENKIGHSLEEISEEELTELRAIYNSMKDGMTKRDDWFNVRKIENAVCFAELAEAIKKHPESGCPEIPDNSDPEVMPEINSGIDLLIHLVKSGRKEEDVRRTVKSALEKDFEALAAEELETAKNLFI